LKRQENPRRYQIYQRKFYAPQNYQHFLRKEKKMRGKSILAVVIVVCWVGVAEGGWIINEGDFYSDSIVVWGGTITTDIDVLMNGGTIMQNLNLKEGAYGEIYGGDIRNFLVIDDISEASMYGGHIGSGISSPEDGKFNWYGGTIDGQIRSGWTSTPNCHSYHKIYGYDFKIDGETVGECILTYEGFQRHLTGFLQDGTTIDNYLVIYGGSKIELVVIPELTTLFLVGLGSLILRRRK